MPNPRKPRSLKVLEGTLRPARDYPEPDFNTVSADEASPPDWLSTADAVAEWNRLVTLLTASRVLAEGDMTALGHLCNLHGNCVRLYRANMEPTAAQLTQLRLLSAEFGLTPSSRSKAGTVGDGAKKNPFRKLG